MFVSVMTDAQYKLPGKKPSILALVMLISLASVGAVLYSPSIPHLASYFSVDPGVIQYTMTLFLLGYACGQLIYGPLSNRFGRRASLFCGIWLGIVSALLCGLSAPLHSIVLLLIMRFFLAVGAGVGLTVTITIINDFFYTEQLRAILPIIAMSFAIMPGIAIFVGGLITYYLDWQICFYFLAAYYVAALFIVRSLPETLPNKDLSALKVENLIRDYWPLRKNLQLIGYATLVASCTLFIYVFSAQGPLIATYKLGLNAAAYGGLVLIPSFFILFGNFILSRYSKKISMNKFMVVSIPVMFICSLSLMLIVLTHHLQIWSFFFLISVIYFVNPMLWNSASVLATQRVSNKSNASAILSAINVSGGFAGVLIAGIFARYPEHVMSFLFTGVTIYMAAMAFWLFWKLQVAQK